MTRGEIWKDFFKRTVLPAVIALFLFFMFKNVFTEDGQTNYFYVWLCCGIPFGKHLDPYIRGFRQSVVDILTIDIL